MFDETTPNQNPNVPAGSGPLPGEPMQPIGQPMGTPVNVRPVPSAFQPVTPPPSPSTPPPLPPLPPTLPMEDHPGGKMKRILLIAVIVLLLIAAGVAVAFLLPTNQATNTTTNVTANTNSAATNVNKANANAAANLTANAATNLTTNGTTNAQKNTNTTNTANKNTNVTVNATNAATNSSNANANKATNTTTNAATNSSTNANTNTAPASYSTDTDNDSFNNYLEAWMLTNTKTADSDGDTFLDGKEVSGGYSPLSKGKLSVAGLETYCAASPVVTQYGFSATDAQAFCGIAGDVLSKIQIMATNATFYEDIDSLLSRSCSSFGKIDSADCQAIVRFLIPAYASTNSTT